MNGRDAACLMLLIRDHGARVTRLLDLTGLKPFVSGVVVLQSGSGHNLFPLIDKAFPDIDVQQLRLDSVDSPAHWTRQLREAVSRADRWLLLLEAGCNAVTPPGFKPPEKRVPHRVLHYSSISGEGCWAPVLAPAIPDLVSIASTGRIIFNATTADSLLADQLAIECSGNMEPTAALCLPVLNDAVEAYRRSGDPRDCLDIARCHDRAGRVHQALFWYRRYLHAGLEDHRAHWLASYRLARAMEVNGNPWREVEMALLDAFDADPGRAEPLYRLALHYREAGDWDKAFELAGVGLDIEMPVTDDPFEWSVYQHELPLLYMECARELGRDRECIAVANAALRRPHMPESARIEAARHRSHCLERLQPPTRPRSHRSDQIVVITPFRNAGAFLKSCTDSLVSQDYSRCRFVLIDDASDDGALDALSLDDPRFVIVRNPLRRGGFQNQIDALEHYCAPDDIAVYVDGDDRLLGSDALAHINEFFNATGCWLMYGQYRDTGGRYGRCEPIVGEHDHVLDAIRDMHFPMHIRAHRAGLFDRLRERDPNLSYLRDENGDFLEAITDMTLMRALMQLCGLAHIRYNDRIVYEYNTLNPGSHFRDHKMLQDLQCRALNAKAPLGPVASYLGD